MKVFRRKRRRISATSASRRSRYVNSESAGFQLSAAYIEDAIAGRFYKSGLGRSLEEKRNISVWCLRLTSHYMYSTFLFLVVTFHCVLSAFEPVQMIAKESKHLHPLSLWGGLSCCIVYLIDIILSLAYSRPRQFFAFIHWRLYVLCVCLLTSDNILFLSLGRMVFRSLRPSLLIFRIHPLRSTGLVMLGVTPKFLQFLLIMGAYVALFSVIGVHLFMDTYVDNDVVQSQHDGIYEGAFDNLAIAILQVFVLMTGGSYPRFMIPAYDKHKPVALFYFIIIIVTGEIILYAILVAQIYDFYEKANKNHVKEERHHERQCLIKAFEILDHNNEGSINFSQWKGIMNCLRPKATTSEVNKRFRKLKELSKNDVSSDESGDSSEDDYWSINVVEFFYLPNVMQFTVEKTKPRRSFAENSDSNDDKFQIFKRINKKVTSLCWMWCKSRWASLFSITVNTLYVLPFAIYWYGMQSITLKIAGIAEIVFLVLITLETLVQFVALGAPYMLQEMLLHVTMVVITLSTTIYVHTTPYKVDGWSEVAGHLAMIVRLACFKKKSSSMFHWLRRIAPPLITLLCVICISFYTYGVIGMECFGSLDSDNVLSSGVSLCRHGFEDLGCSLLTLFQISLGSSWHKMMHYIMDEVSVYSCIYFIFFYTLMQMLVLNVISAVVVELSNAVYNDESEAKQRDKECGRFSREDSTSANRRGRRNTQNSDDSLFFKKKWSTASTSSVVAAVSMATGLVGLDPALLSPHSREQCTTPINTSGITTSNKPEQQSRKISKESTVCRPKRLPSIIEEDLIVEDVDEVTLTGRKELGKWTREILSDMTFLNADDLKRLQQEMGRSAEGLSMKNRKRISSNNSDSNKESRENT